MSDLRAVVRLRGFRRLFATRLIAQSADGTFQVALASYLFFSPERQTTAGDAAAAFAAVLLPYSFVAPFAGVFLDRWQRRQVLVYANLLRAAMVVGVAAVVVADLPDPVLYGSALAVLSVNRFFLSGLSAGLPHVVPADELIMANSVSTTSGAIATLIGVAVGFVVRLGVGEGDDAAALTLLAAAVGYLGSAAVARTFARERLGPDFDPARPETVEAVRRVARGLVEGARHIWVRRPAARALGTIAVHRLSYGVLTVSALLLYRNTFYDDADAALGGLAVALGATGVGIIAAVVVTPPASARLGKPGWIVACLLIAAAAQAIFVAPYVEPLIVAGGFTLGLVSQGTKICVDTIVQESSDDAFRGRVFSIYDMVYNIAFVLAAVFAALVLPTSGRSHAVVALIAVVYVLTAIAYARASMKGPVRR
jgi:MFS family permease